MTAAALKPSFHSDQLRAPTTSTSSAGRKTTNDDGASPASTPVKSDGIKALVGSSTETAALSAALPSASAAATTTSPLPQFRNHVFHLSTLVGQLAAILLHQFPLDDGSRAIALEASSTATLSDKYGDFLSPDDASCMPFRRVTSEMWSVLVASAALLSLHLPQSILQKVELNRRKYPVELCRGKAGKYTEYSEATGITKTHGQSMTDSIESSDESEGKDADPFSSLVVGRLTVAIREFATERQWSVYHRPRNLVLALMGELGELAELVQWNGDRAESLTDEQLDKLSQELADVAIYLLRLADVCGSDLLLESKEASRGNTAEND